MSKLIRHGKSVSKLASALCLLSAGAATAGGNVPKLVKTTTPIRVKPDATRGITPQFSFPVDASRSNLTGGKLQRLSDDSPALRRLLEPDHSTSLNPLVRQTAVGVPRTNQFVELQGDITTDKSRKVSNTRSAPIPQRKRHRRGAIQKNPLVVDAPPKLRRFSVEERPLIVPTIDQENLSEGVLVAREQPMPSQPVANLDQALEALSTQSANELAIRGAAQESGFGMLAIDQIGDHVGTSNSDDSEISYPPLERFATDLVLPQGQLPDSESGAMTNTFRNQLGSIETSGLIDLTVPPLPPPTQPSSSAASVSVSRATSDMAPRVARTSSRRTSQLGSIASQPKLPSPFRPNLDGQVALEVDELIAASAAQQKPATQLEPPKVAQKPSLTQRFSVWSKRLTSSRKESPSKSASSRLPNDPSNFGTTPTISKRSGGILTQWLGRAR